MKITELKEMIKAAMMDEVQNKVSEQTGQFKKGDKVKYDGEKHLVVNILKDGSPVLVPMSVIDDEAFSIDSDEIEESKTMDEIQYDIDDTNADYDFLAEEYEATDHDIQIGPAMVGMVNIRKYLEKSAPEYLSDLKAIDSVLTSYDNKMAYGDDDLGVPGDNALGLEEAEEEVDAEEVDVKAGDEEIETTDVEMTTEVDPNVKAVQDSLTAAQAAAAALGDEKLTDQIGNTITFFTRQHVANIDSMNESINESTVRRGTDGQINKLL
jgi:hypothetical protein